YQELLRARGETPVSFESGVRRDLIIGTLEEAYADSSFVPQTVARKLAALSEQQREVSVHQLSPDAYLGAVKLEPEAAKKYYDSHLADFQTPEQVRVEFVAVSLDALAAKETVSAEELKEAFEANKALYARAEQRRISHILIAVDPKASEDDKQAARLKADRLLAEAKAGPAAFAAVAKRESQDPGSAAKGGDLGLLPRGALNDMPALEDLAFSLAPGATGGPVATRFGVHLVRVAEVKTRSFDEVKAQLEAEIRKRKAQKRYAEMGEQLSSLAFETPDSLKPAAEKLKLPLQTSGWLTRAGGADKLLDNPKLLKAVFGEESLKDRRNTDAIDVGSAIVAARVVEHKPVGTKPFAEVSADITRRLTRERAVQL
ncbi:MAG: peptidyl-prolyl cis-trans isomerase, partial [Myxococcota bacterium]